jgi:hypothetical protein
MRTGGAGNSILRSSEVRGGAFYAAMTQERNDSAKLVASLKSAARVNNIERRNGRNVPRAEVFLAPAEGKGYFSLTQIDRELLVIVDDYSASELHYEPIRDGELIPTGNARH